jgi:hypoxanthine phosphoribosyltransferase
MDKLSSILAILTVIGFAGSLPQIWGSDWREIAQYRIQGIVPWNLVHKQIQEVIRKIQVEGFRPNLIIGIGRGGTICAGIMCSELMGEFLIEKAMQGKESTSTADISLRTINSKIFIRDLQKQVTGKDQLTPNIEKIELSEPDIKIRGNEKVLLIVAQNFTGSTLEKSVNLLTMKGIPRQNIRTVAIYWHRHKKIHSVHDPDIYGQVVSINKTMPWKDHSISTNRF